MAQEALNYKGYTASIQYNEEEKCLIGEVVGIDHIIFFRGTTSEDIYGTFKEMIDEYLEDCTKEGIEPNKPPTEIMVPIPAELYAEASYRAEHEGVPIQTIMKNALQNFVSQHP
jgi:predicted HicB family RNase H-like nuclease